MVQGIGFKVQGSRFSVLGLRFRSLLENIFVFWYILVIEGNPWDCLWRTVPGNGTIITIITQVMVNLEVHRSIAEIVASLDAFPARITKIQVYSVFKIWLFNKTPSDSACRTLFPFSSGACCFDSLPEVSSAQVAVSAHDICMSAFNSRRGFYTFCLALAALCAFKWVYLPDISFCRSFPCQEKRKRDQRCYQNDLSGVPDEIAAGLIFILLFLHFWER